MAIAGDMATCAAVSLFSECVTSMCVRLWGTPQQHRRLVRHRLRHVMLAVAIVRRIRVGRRHAAATKHGTAQRTAYETEPIFCDDAMEAPGGKTRHCHRDGRRIRMSTPFQARNVYESQIDVLIFTILSHILH